MLVECTRPWWWNKTYYKTGSRVEVPEGTPIPSGFIVDGKATPTKSELKALNKASEPQPLPSGGDKTRRN